MKTAWLVLLTVSLAMCASWACHRAPQQPRDDGWGGLLLKPQGDRKLPHTWKVARNPKLTRPLAAAGGGVGWNYPDTVDRLIDESEVVVVGVCVGNDGGVYDRNEMYNRPGFPQDERTQHTTYYLRVEGYIKDARNRRAPYLKIMAPGGWLGHGQTTGEGMLFPYLTTGTRYLLYLTPNWGYEWGLKDVVTSTEKLGNGDEYWTTGMRNGLWRDYDGTMNGNVREPGKKEGLGLDLPFGEAMRLIVAAGVRHRTLPPAAGRLR